ncbi:MAG: site-2 protease family protein, partial [Clostridia bacterium]|nr:site-2 protease family protein [Clostridia bacterium]
MLKPESLSAVSRANRGGITISTFISIVVAIVVFSILILVHEAGHFTAAKLSGVKVNEFSLGMGPAILKHKKGETQYSLRIFPIGGFVSMEGEDAASDDKRSFFRAKLWKRMVIICSGAIMNIVLGFLLAVVFILLSSVHTTVVSGFYNGSVSNKTGLRAGDRIVA